VFIAHARHPPDDRLGKAPGTLADLRHWFPSSLHDYAGKRILTDILSVVQPILWIYLQIYELQCFCGPRGARSENEIEIARALVSNIQLAFFYALLVLMQSL
jgi:hypothetical protein